MHLTEEVLFFLPQTKFLFFLKFVDPTFFCFFGILISDSLLYYLLVCSVLLFFSLLLCLCVSFLLFLSVSTMRKQEGEIDSESSIGKTHFLFFSLLVMYNVKRTIYFSKHHSKNLFFIKLFQSPYV